MENLQKQIANILKAKLEKQMNFTKIDISCVNLDSEEDKSYYIHLYSSDYNYKKVDLNYVEGFSSDKYITSIKNSLFDGRYENHIATPEEIYVGELLRKYKTKGLYIFEGMLFTNDGRYEVSLSDVKYMNYSKKDGTLEFIEVSDECMEIDFINSTIKWINEESGEIGQTK
jgi:hypothetical protein